ncbi:MAG: helix-turn-helix domain-containing protein [Alphaproteobacteria bacterium]|nr:helix-turn-helix domain-containing protein [Alphaproteobacteria bacterium]
MNKEYIKKRKNQHMSLAEWIKIEVGLATNQSIRSIAKQLKHSVSSISVVSY